MTHDNAKRDARNKLTSGQIHTVVIIEEDVGEQTALTKIQKIKTFVKSDEIDLSYADTVTVKIVDVGPNHADAVPLAVVG